jgi:hypothetical protein
MQGGPIQSIDDKDAPVIPRSGEHLIAGEYCGN